MLRVQRLVPRAPARVLAPAIRAMGTQRFVDWSFDHYLAIAPPSFALAGPPRRPLGERRSAAADSLAAAERLRPRAARGRGGAAAAPPDDAGTGTRPATRAPGARPRRSRPRRPSRRS